MIISNRENLKYKIPDEVSGRYEELISFNRGRDFNGEVAEAVDKFRKQFSEYINDDNRDAFEKRTDEFNKLFVDLTVSWMSAIKIPSAMIVGPARYPEKRKRKEEERVHKLQGELYSDHGKMARFMERTEEMFNPSCVQQRKKLADKHAEQAKDKGWSDCYNKLDHDELDGYGIDLEANRIYIKTKGKPSVETRSLLKKAALRWSPRNKRWQRQLTENAIRSINRNVMEPLEFKNMEI